MELQSQKGVGGDSSADLGWLKLWNGILRSHYSAVYSVTAMSDFFS